MKLDECRNMEKGTKVYISLGNGWFQEATYNKLIMVTKFGNMSFSELMRGDFTLDKGKKVWEASVNLVDEKGRTKECYINPRRLRKVI